MIAHAMADNAILITDKVYSPIIQFIYFNVYVRGLLLTYRLMAVGASVKNRIESLLTGHCVKCTLCGTFVQHSDQRATYHRNTGVGGCVLHVLNREVELVVKNKDAA